MRLSKIIDLLKPCSVQAFSEKEITHLAFDSREVRDDTLFFAFPGTHHDGHDFIRDAVERGACACVVEKMTTEVPVPLVEVADCHAALSRIAAHFYEFPSKELTVVGITGTNGKTTTAFLIRHVLQLTGRSAGLIGTLGAFIGDEVRRLPNTTPESLVLQQILRAMVDKKLNTCVMEISSHGIKLGRIRHIDFDFAVLTNISRDHLDFHRSFEDYVSTKLQFFIDLKNDATAIINQDANESIRFIESTSASCKIYGMNGAPDFRGKVLDIDEHGMKLLVAHRDGEQKLFSPLRGRYHAYNIVAAFACLHSMGLDGTEIAEVIGSFAGVPGRAHKIDMGLGFVCIVDYAHTPDALFNLFSAERELTRGRLICVFGAGGDRDVGKRPEMGKVASELCDIIVLTSDNPRSEKPTAIIDDIQKGMDGKQVTVEVVRKKAIERSLSMAREGDTVVIAGKGHESYQEAQGKKVLFSDIEYAESCMKAIHQQKESE
jgi:UDP-N-acetylmuramoyl-L-alanyl-D-glutamate--2,6-diaminopimelate ligase